MIKDIMICADDYAQNEFISQGIVTLCAQGRINALSCMVNSPQWGELHQELHPLKESVFIGLHLNLTFGQALSALWREKIGENFTGLPKLLSLAYLRRLELSVVMAEIHAQLDLFIHDLHIYPDFIDGHQHVHQFPVIRNALMLVCAEHQRLASPHLPEENPPMPCFVRHSFNGWKDFVSLRGFPKSQTLALLGGAHFKRQLKTSKIPSNLCFAGVYDFKIKTAREYRVQFKHFLKNMQQGGLIMCHPGLSSEDLSDPLRESRPREMDYLLGNEFLSDLADNAVQLLQKSH